MGLLSAKCCQKRKPHKKSTQQLHAAMPTYRPAGPNIGPPKRGLNETVADQVRRMALAKAGPQHRQEAERGGRPTPVQPKGPPPVRGEGVNVPKEPPRPPPKHISFPKMLIPPLVPPPMAKATDVASTFVLPSPKSMPAKSAAIRPTSAPKIGKAAVPHRREAATEDSL